MDAHEEDRRSKNPFLFGMMQAAAAALPKEARADLLFEDQGVDKLGAQPCNGQGCWTNYARMIDVDSDVDLDLIGVNCGGSSRTRSLSLSH